MPLGMIRNCASVVIKQLLYYCCALHHINIINYDGRLTCIIVHNIYDYTEKYILNMCLHAEQQLLYGI